MDKKNKILLILFLLLAVLSISATFYNYVVLENFYIENDLSEADGE